MAQSKKMNAAGFAKLVKELDSVGELILTKQNEKQSVMDDFEKEKVRFSKGKISEDTLASSAKKVNVELARLDKGTREAIVKISKIAVLSKEFAGRQAPKIFKASVSGLKWSNNPARKATKEVVKKVKDGHAKHGAKASKTVLAKEKTIDRKFIKKKK